MLQIFSKGIFGFDKECKKTKIKPHCLKKKYKKELSIKL